MLPSIFLIIGISFRAYAYRQSVRWLGYDRYSVCGSQSDATRNFGTSLWHLPKLHALPSPQTVDSAAGIYLISVRQKELVLAENGTHETSERRRGYHFSSELLLRNAARARHRSVEVEGIGSSGSAESGSLPSRGSTSIKGPLRTRDHISARSIGAIRGVISTRGGGYHIRDIGQTLGRLVNI